MKRVKCIEAIYPELQDKLVVTIMGACAQELYDLGPAELGLEVPPTQVLGDGPAGQRVAQALGDAERLRFGLRAIDHDIDVCCCGGGGSAGTGP